MLTAAMPEFVTQIANALQDASPMILILIGAVLFLFSGTLKWLVKWVGAAMAIYGILCLLGYI